jgi:hypothetical protein
MLAILLSKRDFKKHRGRAVKRLNYVAEIFLDTVDVYDNFISYELPITNQVNANNELCYENNKADLYITKKGKNGEAKLESFELIASTIKH